MCAVIGVVIQKPNEIDFKMIKSIFIESKIRGMHATGVSIVGKENEILTVKQPVDSSNFKFLDNLKEYVNNDGNLYLIGHCRYSTSDLQFNQPISNMNVSISHNGVITQELPEKWESLFGYQCETKNDSELILHSLEEGLSPLEKWAASSLAVCELYKTKKLRSYRNGKRPIYLTTLQNGFIITSTKNIPKRAGVIGETEEIPMNVYCSIENFNLSYESVVNTGFVDLQHQ